MKNKEIFKKINVTPLKFFKDDDEKNNYILLGQQSDQKRVLVKIAKIGSDVARSYKNEVAAEKIVENIGLSHVAVVDSGESDGFFWVIRQFINGRALSDYGQALTLYGYDIIVEQILPRRDEILDQVIANIKLLSTTITEMPQKRFPVKLGELKYLDNLPFSPDALKKYYKKIQDKYQNLPQIICTGDLTPANIILSEDNKVYFSDFSWLCSDNYLVDTTYLWLFLWRYEDWQKKLVRNLVRTEMDREIFKMNIIRLVFFWYDNFYRYNLEKNDEQSKLRMEAYNSHRWLEYLRKIESGNDDFIS